MKRLFVLLAAAFPWPSLAQVPLDSVMSVSASRVTRIAPDRASLYVIVEGTAETAPDAIARVETKLKAVTDALKAFGPRVRLTGGGSFQFQGPNSLNFDNRCSQPTQVPDIPITTSVTVQFRLLP